MLRFHPPPERKRPVKSPPASASARQPLPPFLTSRQPSREENSLHDAMASQQQDSACRRRSSRLSAAPLAALHDARRCLPQRAAKGAGSHEGEGSCRG